MIDNHVYLHRVTEDDLKRFLSPDIRERRKFEKAYTRAHEGSRQRLIFLMKVAAAVKRKDRQSLANTIHSYVDAGLHNADMEKYITNLNTWSVLLNNSPMYTVNEEINDLLGGTRAVLWQTKSKKVEVGVYCKDVIAALCVLWVFQLNQPAGVGICLNNRCSKPFDRERSNQKYCSQKCQNFSGVVRFRRKKGEQA